MIKKFSTRYGALLLILIGLVLIHYVKKKKTTLQEVENENTISDLYQDMMKEIQELSEEVISLKDMSNKDEKEKDILLRSSRMNNKICQMSYDIVILCLQNNNTNDIRRNLIRNTWGKDRHILTTNGLVKLNWKLIFIMEDHYKMEVKKKREEECLLHNDMIVINNSNSMIVNTESFKLMLGLQYIERNCKFQFLLTIKDTMVINVPVLFSFFRDEKTPSTELYGGNIEYERVRYKTSGLIQMYPRYAGGGSFVMSVDVVSKIIPLFNWETTNEFTEYIGQLVLKSGIDVLSIDFFVEIDDGEDGECIPSDPAAMVVEVLKLDCYEIMYNIFRKIIPEL